MTTFSLAAPAKINLMLRVLGRREDGYHELQSLMLPLTVGDQLDFRAVGAGSPRPGEGTSPLCITCDNPDVPVDDDSLLARAYRFAAGRLDYSGGLEIHLKKRIPMGAGLGGGSSDAATVMKAVETLSGRRVPRDAYPDIARDLGADIPFFLAEGAQWIEGIGERLQPCPLSCKFYILLMNPGIHVNTASVYQELPPELTRRGPPDNVPPSFETLEALLPYVTNDLESVVLSQYPAINALKQRMQELGADAALMSGSGSTVFGLFSQKIERDRARKILKQGEPGSWIDVADYSGIVQW